MTLTFLLLACAAAAADCTCRAKGRDYQHDERICLSGPNGPRLATCGMNQNVASWILTDQPCAVSTLTFPATFAIRGASSGADALH